MQLLDLTLPTPAENLALDEALLLEAEERQSGEVLRFWELPTYAVVLGSAGKVQDDVDVMACERDGIAIVRRCSGGGTVLLGPGCLCFALVLQVARPGLEEVRTSYARILGQVGTALGKSTTLAGSSDLICQGQKFSGNSQRRLRAHVLHHGTVLYQFDVAQLSRYLRMPSRRPEYRGDRSHEAFVRNWAMGRDEIKGRLVMAWEANEALTTYPLDRVKHLVETKYDRPEWTNRL